MAVGRLDLSAKLYQKFLRQHLEKLARNEPLRSPVVVDLDPTTFCDLACPECISGKLLNRGRFSPERLERLASELVDAGVHAVILIGGGEPLAHQATSRVIEILGTAGVAIGVVTNGTLIGRHLDVLARYATWVRVSMDAGTSATYRQFRPDRAGRSKFDRVIENMTLLARAKSGALGYSYLLITRWDDHGRARQTNVSEIADAARLAKQIGCDYFEVKSSFDENHFVEAHPLDVREELANQLAQLDELRTEHFDVVYSSTLTSLLGNVGAEQPKSYTTCKTAELRTLVTSEGVYVCAYHRGNELMRIGDVVDTPFDQMWQSADRTTVNPSVDCRFNCARHPSNLILNELGAGRLPDDVVDDYDPFI